MTIRKQRKQKSKGQLTAEGAMVGAAVDGVAAHALSPVMSPVGAAVGGYAGAKIADSKASRSQNNPRPFKARPHKWDEVLIQRQGKKITRKQIRDYYNRNAKKIWPFLKGQTVMVIMATKKNTFVRMRHGPDGNFIKLNRLEGIDDPNSFEYWINRRISSFIRRSQPNRLPFSGST